VAFFRSLFRSSLIVLLAQGGPQNEMERATVDPAVPAPLTLEIAQVLFDEAWYEHVLRHAHGEQLGVRSERVSADRIEVEVFSIGAHHKAPTGARTKLVFERDADRRVSVGAHLKFHSDVVLVGPHGEVDPNRGVYRELEGTVFVDRDPFECDEPWESWHCKFRIEGTAWKKRNIVMGAFQIEPAVAESR